ncbi:MAG: 50S ribosomal protein L28 [Ignavibacteria bacterium]|nr:50S ribosomal protein L28 [Ignavibacteria bacterium]
MSRVCAITGKKSMTGNKVSHANNRTKRKQHPNLQKKRIWDVSKKRWVTMKISTEAMRTLAKKGYKI